MIKRIWMPILALAMSGCTTLEPLGATPGSAPHSRLSCSERVQPSDRVHLEMVDSMASEGRRYAALAQLESRRLAALPHWLRYGQLKAGTNELAKAEQVFRSLVRRCGAGEAHHGLGLVLVKAGREQEGLHYLQQARQRLPASASVRNDLGYTLMLNGDYEAAEREFWTALELHDSATSPARQNLLTNYLLMGEHSRLDSFIRSQNVDDESLRQARQLAAQVRGGQR